MAAPPERSDYRCRPALAGNFQGNVVCDAERFIVLTQCAKVGGRRRGEVDANGRVQRTQPYPKCKRRVPQPLQDGEVVMLGVLSLWRASPAFYYDGSAEPGGSWLEAAIRLWESGLDNSVKASAIVSLIMTSRPILVAPSLGERTERLTKFMQRLMYDSVPSPAAVRTADFFLADRCVFYASART